MYTNLIIGVDGRRGGADAAALAAQLASPGAFMALVYVSSLPYASRASKRELDLADESALPELFAHELDLCGGEARVLRVNARTVGEGLERAAATRGADVIVVGATHRRGWWRVLLGDDVKSVLHHTPCAVAIAPAQHAEHPTPLARIGVACDASPESLVALAHGGLLAAERRSDLLVRHVVTPHYYAPGYGMTPVPVEVPTEEVDAARRLLHQIDGVPVDHVYGLTGERLLELCARVDLLVCGSRHHGLLRRLADGSTSGYLAGHAEVPLLITPAVDDPTVERWRAHQGSAVG
ncbi:MAG TPA: universal stress protein [Solirubrobacteraceae bacterium]|nr:universal stress protein [Solirubrobacteraceae bacterium]